jgi:hypothetical protein
MTWPIRRTDSGARESLGLPRPELLKLHELSEGNPLFALELVRSRHARHVSPDGVSLLGTLQEALGYRQRPAGRFVRGPFLEAQCEVDGVGAGLVQASSR